MNVHELISDVEIEAAFPLMSELRTHLERGHFIGVVRRQQIEGYRLFGGTVGTRLVALAGVRRTHTLARGEHLFVDDLVVAEKRKRKGHGTALMSWLARWAAAQGLAEIYLDSRDTAVGFYRRLGYVAKPSVPMRVQVAGFPARGGAHKRSVSA